jgi:hypothetical protein
MARVRVARGISKDRGKGRGKGKAGGGKNKVKDKVRVRGKGRGKGATKSKRKAEAKAEAAVAISNKESGEAGKGVLAAPLRGTKKRTPLLAGRAKVPPRPKGNRRVRGTALRRKEALKTP